MPTIERVFAREILDSRGKPTVEAEVLLSGGVVGRASVPSGASTGAAEACELRDGEAERYDGQGVRKAVQNVIEQIGPALAGMNATDQAKLDERLVALDGTTDKSRLGANALLSVSLATCRGAALASGMPLYAYIAGLLPGVAREARAFRLPRPMTNMISGGKHAGGNLDFQDILIAPAAEIELDRQLEWIVRVYRRLGKLLGDAGYEGYLVGDEGGYGPRLRDNREAVSFVVWAIEQAGLKPGVDVFIALDVAASHFYREGTYQLAAEQGQKLTSGQMIDRLEAWIGEFPIASIEDGLAENDWAGWREMTARIGQRVTLVGDDLFATNAKLLSRGVQEKVGNAILIKVNQIGTLSETLTTVALAKQQGYQTIVSARSGETEDDFLADLAVGVQGDYIKIGSIARSERLAKYNRLLRIAEEVG